MTAPGRILAQPGVSATVGPAEVLMERGLSDHVHINFSLAQRAGRPAAPPLPQWVVGSAEFERHFLALESVADLERLPHFTRLEYHKMLIHEAGCRAERARRAGRLAAPATPQARAAQLVVVGRILAAKDWAFARRLSGQPAVVEHVECKGGRLRLRDPACGIRRRSPRSSRRHGARP